MTPQSPQPQQRTCNRATLSLASSSASSRFARDMLGLQLHTVPTAWFRLSRDVMHAYLARQHTKLDPHMHTDRHGHTCFAQKHKSHAGMLLRCFWKSPAAWCSDPSNFQECYRICSSGQKPKVMDFNLRQSCGDLRQSCGHSCTLSYKKTKFP